MVHLLCLPAEIHSLIAEHLDYASEVNALGRTCRGLYGSANRRLYTHFSSDISPRGFSKIIQNKNVDALRKILPILLDPECDENEFFEGQGIFLEKNAAKKLLAVIEIFINLYGPSFAHAALIPDDLVVLKVLAGAAKFTRIGELALSISASKGSLDCVRFLLDSGCKVDAVDGEGYTALMNAAESGHLEVVKCLLDAGADPNLICTPRYTGPYRSTPLFKAVSGEHEPVVRYLLEKGAHLGTPGEINPHEVDDLVKYHTGAALAKLILDSTGVDLNTKVPLLSPDEMSSYLRYAAAIGDSATIESLAHCGTAYDIIMPLVSAAQHGHVGIVKTLLERLPEFFLEESEIQDCCNEAVESAAMNEHQSVVAALLDFAEQQGFYSVARRGLITAVDLGLETLCQFLVERGALKEAGSDFVDDSQILEMAITAGNHTLLKQMMDLHGYDPFCTFEWNRGSHRECTILERVAENSLDLFKTVLSWGPVTLDPSDLICQNALLRATARGKTDIIAYFLQHGFDVNGAYCLRDCYGNWDDDSVVTVSLLSQSAGSWNHYDPSNASSTTEFLLDQGADVNAVGCHGRTALAEVARDRKDLPMTRMPTTRGDLSVAKVLVARGADPLVSFEKCQSALQNAIFNQNFELVEFFLQTIDARGYKCDRLDSFICYVLDNIKMPKRRRSDPEFWWDMFFLVKALRGYYWRAACPVPDT